MTPACIYDGRQAVGVRGSLVREGAIFRFQRGDMDESSVFEAKYVKSVEKVGRSLYLEYHHHGRKRRTLLIELFDVEYAPELRKGFRACGGRTAFRHLIWGRFPTAFWVGLLMLMLPVAYWGYPRGAESLSQFLPMSWEEKLGDHVYNQVTTFYTERENHADLPELQAMVDQLASGSSRFPMQVAVIDMPQVNAFALPGGHIVVSTGLLKYTRDRNIWAGVLGHEVAHVEERHVMRSLTRSVGTLYVFSIAVGGGIEGFEMTEQAIEYAGLLTHLEHSRRMESEADRVSVQKLLELNKDPRGLIKLFAYFETQGLGNDQLNFLSSHPMNEERITAIEEMIPANQTYSNW